MHIVRLGRRTLNLEYLIMAEESDTAPGVLKVVMDNGIVRELDGDAADKVRRRLDDIDPPTGAGAEEITDLASLEGSPPGEADPLRRAAP